VCECWNFAHGSLKEIDCKATTFANEFPYSMSAYLEDRKLCMSRNIKEFRDRWKRCIWKCSSTFCCEFGKGKPSPQEIWLSKIRTSPSLISSSALDPRHTRSPWLGGSEPLSTSAKICLSVTKEGVHFFALIPSRLNFRGGVHLAREDSGSYQPYVIMKTSTVSRVRVPYG
jgi:hypothetical protein